MWKLHVFFGEWTPHDDLRRDLYVLQPLLNRKLCLILYIFFFNVDCKIKAWGAAEGWCLSGTQWKNIRPALLLLPKHVTPTFVSMRLSSQTCSSRSKRTICCPLVCTVSPVFSCTNWTSVPFYGGRKHKRMKALWCDNEQVTWHDCVTEWGWMDLALDSFCYHYFLFLWGPPPSPALVFNGPSPPFPFHSSSFP